MEARVHSIEQFSTVDGPGIRTVIFMQGCDLRCKFCHNPDTWDKEAGRIVDSEYIIKEIIKNRKYFKNSNGGVTFSGGEPLIQIDFLIDICKKLKEYDIHIAIDTSGNGFENYGKMNELLKYIDLVILDIKHINNIEHKKLTGIENTKTLEFANYLSGKIDIWIRIVYLPKITDINNSLEKCRNFIRTLINVKKIEVLPYHELGKYKWENLGYKYLLKDLRIPTIEECRGIEKYLQN